VLIAAAALVLAAAGIGGAMVLGGSDSEEPQPQAEVASTPPASPEPQPDDPVAEERDRTKEDKQAQAPSEPDPARRRSRSSGQEKQTDAKPECPPGLTRSQCADLRAYLSASHGSNTTPKDYCPLSPPSLCKELAEQAEGESDPIGADDCPAAVDPAVCEAIARQQQAG